MKMFVNLTTKIFYIAKECIQSQNPDYLLGKIPSTNDRQRTNRLNTYTATANQRRKDKFNRKMGEGYKRAVYIKETQVASKHLKIYSARHDFRSENENHEGPFCYL